MVEMFDTVMTSASQNNPQPALYTSMYSSVSALV